VLTNEIPLLLQKEIYALAALAGGSFYLVWLKLGYSVTSALWLSVVLTLMIRVIAIRWQVSLPRFRLDG
jgi:uncharacterized membrane protein YeiH